MNILYLKYAVGIAKAGSINKAADELYVAQPNLSRAIKELEKELGIIIFDRNSKGMTLTPDGEKLIQYGKRILKEIEDVENMFKEGAESKAKFSVSVPRASYIGEAMANFSLAANYENNLEILYKETNSLRTIRNVTDDGYNLGIIRYAENYDKYYKQMMEEKGLQCELITEFRYELVMNKNCPMAELSEILYSDLENYIEIAHADPYVPSLPTAIVRKEELPSNVRRRIFVFERASQYEILSKNIDAFMWVSPTPEETLDRFGLVERECAENTRVYKDVMVYKKNYKLSKLDRIFITELYNAKNRYIK